MHCFCRRTLRLLGGHHDQFTPAGYHLDAQGQNGQLAVPTKIRGTIFGNCEFEARHEGSDPLYGILPLKFKGGHLAADIILFAPAAFFNLRAVFPYYQIDVEHGVIRYKNAEGDPWIDYTPKPAEAARARAFFQQHHESAPSS